MKLPSLHPRKVNKALARAGWHKDHQDGGEYIKYKEGHPNPIAVPYHGSVNVKRGTLRVIIKAAGLSREEFLELLGKTRNKRK